MSGDKRDLRLAGILALATTGIVTLMALSPDKEAKAGPTFRPCPFEESIKPDSRGYFMPLESMFAPYGLEAKELQAVQDANGIPTTNLPFELENGILYCTSSIADKIQNFGIISKGSLEEVTEEAVAESSGAGRSDNKINVDFTYYNPDRGGINGMGNYNITASGRNIKDWWWNENNNTGGVACPMQFPYGTTFTLDLSNGEQVKLTCIDRGGDIIIEDDGLVRIDILHNDGITCGDCKKYSAPETKKGVVLNNGPFEATYELPDQ